VVIEGEGEEEEEEGGWEEEDEADAEVRRAARPQPPSTAAARAWASRCWAQDAEEREEGEAAQAGQGARAREGVGGALISGKRGGLMPAREQVARPPELLPAPLRVGAGLSTGGGRVATHSARADSRMSSVQE
jgi:hypothetical protein